jgi:hypothetical protein
MTDEAEARRIWPSWRSVLILAGAVGAVLMVPIAVAFAPWFLLAFQPDRVHLERSLAPDGNYEIVVEVTDSFLDAYSQVWITTPGTIDRRLWQPVAPKVDGSWDRHWLTPMHLLLTDYGAWPETRQPYRDQYWHGVRIETRARPATTISASPDDRHCAATTVVEDSRGRRAEASLRAVWPETGQIELVPSGSWTIATKWLTNDRLQLRLTVPAGTIAPEPPATWRGITISVVR